MLENCNGIALHHITVLQYFWSVESHLGWSTPTVEEALPLAWPGPAGSHAPLLVTVVRIVNSRKLPADRISLH